MAGKNKKYPRKGKLRERRYPKLTSKKCEVWLKMFWSIEEIEEGLKNPERFVREVVNPFFQEKIDEEKPFPLVKIQEKNGRVYLSVSEGFEEV